MLSADPQAERRAANGRCSGRRRRGSSPVCCGARVSPPRFGVQDRGGTNAPETWVKPTPKFQAGPGGKPPRQTEPMPRLEEERDAAALLSYRQRAFDGAAVRRRCCRLFLLALAIEQRGAQRRGRLILVGGLGRAGRDAGGSSSTNTPNELSPSSTSQPVQGNDGPASPRRADRRVGRLSTTGKALRRPKAVSRRGSIYR